jgi:hypothetical protein
MLAPLALVAVARYIPLSSGELVVERPADRSIDYWFEDRCRHWIEFGYDPAVGFENGKLISRGKDLKMCGIPVAEIVATTVPGSLGLPGLWAWLRTDQ